MLFLLFFFVVGVSTLHSAHATHAEVLHVIIVPVITHWLCLIFLVFVDPLSPVRLDVRVLDLVLGQSRPIGSLLIRLYNVQDYVATLGVPLAVFNLDCVEQSQVEAVKMPVRLSP